MFGSWIDWELTEIGKKLKEEFGEKKFVIIHLIFFEQSILLKLLELFRY